MKCPRAVVNTDIYVESVLHKNYDMFIVIETL